MVAGTGAGMMIFREPRWHEWSPFGRWSTKLRRRIIFMCQALILASLATWLWSLWRTFG